MQRSRVRLRSRSHTLTRSTSSAAAAASVMARRTSPSLPSSITVLRASRARMLAKSADVVGIARTISDGTREVAEPGSVQVEKRDRSVVVLGDALVGQRHPGSRGRSHPPLLGPVGADHPSVYARTEGRAFGAGGAVLLSLNAWRGS